MTYAANILQKGTRDKQTGLSCIFTLFKKKKKTFLRSQISAAITPDYCLTKRQKR